jgi:aspartate kinase
MANKKSDKKIVVKFGGSSLADPERLSRAVASVVNEVKRGTKVAVVVSAMGKTTDVLLNTAQNTSNGKLEKHLLDDILSMGERTSIRIFSAALSSSGVESRYFDPRDEEWPIITDACFSNANPHREACQTRIKRNVLPIVEKGIVPVIAGFLGRTPEGKITTLGRGGSDTTAFILGEALGADEVVLATDADGIMSGDPKVVSNPKRLSEIDINTLVGLADSGSKFIHSKALKYKPQLVDVRVINSAHGDLTKEGTIIKGALATELDVEIANDAPINEITVVGDKISSNPAIVAELVAKAKAHTQILGMSMNTNSAILYVSADKPLEALFNDVHKTVIENSEAKVMAVKKDLVFLKIRGVGLEETQGIIGKISENLRINGINISGILTIASSILLFVDWSQREKALVLIRKALRSKEV